MSNPILKVAKRNIDARTANPNELTLDSTKNQLKRYIIKEGTLVFPATAEGIGVRMGISIKHELGYMPFFFTYIKGPQETKYQTVPATIKVQDNEGGTAIIYAGRTNGIYESFLSIYTISMVNKAFSSKEIDYKCIIFVDPSKDGWF
jgi:hypothetical protein